MVLPDGSEKIRFRDVEENGSWEGKLQSCIRNVIPVYMFEHFVHIPRVLLLTSVSSYSVPYF